MYFAFSTTKRITPVLVLILSLNSIAQTTNGNGTDWRNNGNWVTTSPGTYAAGPPQTLSYTNQTINVNHPMIVGAHGNDIDMTFSNSNFAGSLNVADGVTFIVYGDMNFENKSMDLVVGDNSTLIVLGDFDLGNQIIIASTGKIVVSGDFNKGGAANQGSYTGDGAVYAGSYSGAADDFIPGDVATGGDQQQMIDDLVDDSFTDVWEFVTGGGATPLPVELVSFSGSTSTVGNKLEWKTASEIDNAYFDVERSEDAKNFYVIGRVEGHGTTNEPQFYSFTDRTPISGIAYYRLKQVDFDGAFEYSKIIVAQGDKVTNARLSTYPNPASDRIYLQGAEVAAITELKLMNIAGQVTADLTNQMKSSGSLTEVALPKVEQGMYYLVYRTASGQSQASKILIK